MGNKYVYVCALNGNCSIEDLEFFDSPAALWNDYVARAVRPQVTQREFTEAIDNSEVIMEKDRVWYRDTMISLDP